tara:strand:- start:6957 stop:7370 length:414 start_codon:yes stop_codon:yes gene_type:complete
MWWVALPKVRRTLEDRQHKIDNDLQEAERLRDEANDALKAYEEALSQARSKASAIASEMSNRIAEEANSKRTELEDKLVQESDDAERRIAAARASALASVRDVAASATADVTAKLMDLSPDPKTIADALDDASKGDS